MRDDLGVHLRRRGNHRPLSERAGNHLFVAQRYAASSFATMDLPGCPPSTFWNREKERERERERESLIERN